MMTAGLSSPETPAIIGATSPPSSSSSPDDTWLARRTTTKLKFTPEEDAKLIELVEELGPKRWIEVSARLGTRNARQCRERYNNYLNPHLRQGLWTAEEDALVERKFAELGPKWNKIGRFFLGRSDNALRNRWMMLARHQAKEKSVIMFAGWRPSVPIVLPILKDPSLAQTVASRDSFEIMEVFRPEEMFDESFTFLTSALD
jgi:hypothetical protein